MIFFYYYYSCALVIFIIKLTPPPSFSDISSFLFFDDVFTDVRVGQPVTSTVYDITSIANHNNPNQLAYD